MKNIISITLATLFLSASASAQPVDMRGQLSGWMACDDGLPDKKQIGIRYIPELYLSHSLKGGKTLDAEISLKAYSNAPIEDISELSDNARLKGYRIWGRYASSQFEARLGLQKINFGPARILRSLKWFDTVDPGDPFELTDGVDALLLRYYFLDNANIWLWGMYGNDELKGLELTKTDPDRVEAGGRFQFPVSGGEMGLTYHQRRIDPEGWNALTGTTVDDGTERRLAVDGIWDIGIGLWFEAVAGRTEIDDATEQWEEFVTVGGDYTFDSGIHIVGEHFIKSAGAGLDDMNKSVELSALSADYGMGLLDRINAIVYYDWESKDSNSLLGWQRSYDDWRLDLLAFSNSNGTSGKMAGDGFQFIVTYNH